MTHNQKLMQELEKLEIKIRQLKNELHVTATEREIYNEQYLNLIMNLENTINQKTQELEKSKGKIEEQNQRLRILFDNVPAAIYQKGTNGDYLFVNRYFEKFFNIDNESISGKTDKEMKIHLNDYEDKRVIDSATVSIGKEIIITLPSGRRNFLVDRIPETDSLGKVVSVIGLMHDVTDLVKAEEKRRDLETRLQTAQKLEAFSLLAAGIAHDFNNILSKMMGYTEIALINHLDDKAKLKQNLKKVMSAGESARGIVHQLLQFGQDKKEKKPMHVAPVLKSYLKLLQASYSNDACLNYKINISNDVVLAEPSQIHQIILNLCNNAYYAVKEKKGTINISLKNIQLAEIENREFLGLKSEQYLKLEVIDDGIGIPQEIIKRIFDPYFSTKGEKGTGLGLSIVHTIVSNLSGTIQVESSPQVGSSFIVHIPVLNVSTIVKEDKKSLPKGIGNIIFVDDIDEITQISKILLEGLGYKVSTFNNSYNALNEFTRNFTDYNLLIANLNMPGLRGTQLAQEFSRIREDFPVILTSGFAEEEVDEGFRDCGIRKILLKPILLTELAVAVSDVLNSEGTSAFLAY